MVAQGHRREVVLPPQGSELAPAERILRRQPLPGGHDIQGVTWTRGDGAPSNLGIQLQESDRQEAPDEEVLPVGTQVIEQTTRVERNQTEIRAAQRTLVVTTGEPMTSPAVPRKQQQGPPRDLLWEVMLAIRKQLYKHVDVDLAEDTELAWLLEAAEKAMFVVVQEAMRCWKEGIKMKLGHWEFPVVFKATKACPKAQQVGNVRNLVETPSCFAHMTDDRLFAGWVTGFVENGAVSYTHLTLPTKA